MLVLDFIWLVFQKVFGQERMKDVGDGLVQVVNFEVNIDYEWKRSNDGIDGLEEFEGVKILEVLVNFK